jgi:polyhydroxybutyrate depolymerase
MLLALGCGGAESTSSADPSPPPAGSDAGPGTPDATTPIPDASTPDAGPTNVPGKHDHKATVAGADRAFIVYVPEKAKGTRAPVVFMFHGTSGDGQKFYAISGWKEKADAEGLIAVFPSALTYCVHEDENDDGDFLDPGENKLTTKWNAGKLGTPEMPLCTPAELAQLTPQQRARVDHPLYDDVAYVRAMLDVLATNYATDPKRIYASGFSNGAGMTARLAVDMPDRFAALHSASGSLGVAPKTSASPPSLVLSLGEIEDGVLASQGGPLPLSESLLRDMPYVKTQFVDPLRITANLADKYTYDERVVSDRKLVRFSYAQSLGGGMNVMHFIAVQGQTHEYPNGKNHPIVLADHLWEFFQTKSLAP